MIPDQNWIGFNELRFEGSDRESGLGYFFFRNGSNNGDEIVKKGDFVGKNIFHIIQMHEHIFFPFLELKQKYLPRYKSDSGSLPFGARRYLTVGPGFVHNNFKWYIYQIINIRVAIFVKSVAANSIFNSLNIYP